MSLLGRDSTTGLPTRARVHDIESIHKDDRIAASHTEFGESMGSFRESRTDPTCHCRMLVTNKVVLATNAHLTFFAQLSTTSCSGVAHSF